jgi:probable HAF family extracellular repeat protein
MTLKDKAPRLVTIWSKAQKTKCKRLLAICILPWLVGIAASIASGQNLTTDKDPRYHFVDVGTLGGPNTFLVYAPPYHDFVPLSMLSGAGVFAGNSETKIADPFFPFCFDDDCLVLHAVSWLKGLLLDLGTIRSGEGENSSAAWISKNGLIVGLSENGQIDPLIGVPSVSAVLWKGGPALNLGTLDGGHDSQASAVNSAGQVVGLSSNLVPDPYSLWGTATQTRAFLWQHGKMSDLGTLPGGTDAMALLINERGQIVGQSYSGDSIVPPAFGCSDSPLTLYGFFWDNGNMLDMGTLGGHCTFPYALNDRGQVVGQSNLAGDTSSHPFVWHPGQNMKDLGTLGGTYGYAVSINNSGEVVGLTTSDNDETLVATTWRSRGAESLGTLPGDFCSAADTINSAGQIVGGSGLFIAPFFPACTDPVEHAVLWDHGRIIDLNQFNPTGSGLTLSEAWFINDAGEIAGTATLDSGQQHIFLLLPCGDHDSCDSDASLVPASTSVAPRGGGSPSRRAPLPVPRGKVRSRGLQSDR